MRLKYIIILLVVTSSFVACDPNDTIEEYSVEHVSSVGELLAGEWYVTYSTTDGVKKATNSKISTYNTTANNGTEMWIDDDKKYWGLKSVIACDPVANTFSAKNVDETYFKIKADIDNGKILPGAATTAAGNKTDSIYFEVTFHEVDDDGNPAPVKRIVSGVRRTGFLEDEHE